MIQSEKDKESNIIVIDYQNSEELKNEQQNKNTTPNKN